MQRIFISYSRSNRPDVESLASDLVHLGHTVWFDKELKGGQDWWNEILEQLQRCDVLLFGVSEASLKSEACRRELQYGLDLDRPVIPVLLSATIAINLLPSSIRRREHVDWTRDTKEGLLKLASSLNALGKVPALPAHLPQPPDIPLSPLVSIAEQLNEKTLNRKQQVLLADELKQLAISPNTAEDARKLMREFLTHPLLLASVKHDIEAVLAKGERSYQTVRPEAESAVLPGGSDAGQSEAQGKLIVGVKKYWKNSLAMFSFTVYLDGDRVATLRTGETRELWVSPGTHRVRIHHGFDRLRKIPGMLVQSEELAVRIESGRIVTVSCWVDGLAGVRLTTEMS